jgi:hypothetical protein
VFPGRYLYPRTGEYKAKKRMAVSCAQQSSIIRVCAALEPIPETLPTEYLREGANRACDDLEFYRLRRISREKIYDSAAENENPKCESENAAFSGNHLNCFLNEPRHFSKPTKCVR